MPKGPSNRIVVEVPVELKRALHAKLSLQGKSLKAWFIEQAQRFVSKPIDPVCGSGGFLSQTPKEK